MDMHTTEARLADTESLLHGCQSYVIGNFHMYQDLDRPSKLNKCKCDVGLHKGATHKRTIQRGTHNIGKHSTRYGENVEA